MKRYLMTFCCLALCVAMKAQSSYTCRYWFDTDEPQASIVTIGSSWQMQLDVANLREGPHFLHMHFADASMRWSPVKTYLFLKQMLVESFDMSHLTYRCWFDQDLEHQQTDTLGNGSLLLDVTGLRDGLHFVHLLLEGESMTSAKSYLFLKTAPPSPSEEWQYHCWFDEDCCMVQEGMLGDGSFLLDASDLSVGQHTLNMQLYNGTLTVPQCYSFHRTPMINVNAHPTEGGTASLQIQDSLCTLTAMSNENFTFLYWTKDGTVVSTDSIYTITMTEDATFVANFTDTDIILTQTATFAQDWNWWSGYIELDGSSLGQMQEGFGTNGLTIKSQNDGYSSYLEGMGWYGSLAAIDNESTYQVRTANACAMSLTGSMANPSDHPITLNPGWTWVGYPVNTPMSVIDALAGITPQTGDMIKSQTDGYAYYLEGIGWFGSLNTIQPGMGLMFKSNSASAVTLVYPNGRTRTDLKANQTAENNHWQSNLNAYPDNMSVMAVVELDGIELQGENYELATFANGECRGSARLFYVEPLNRYMAFLTIAGDEADELHFGLYDTETDAVETQNFASLQYETNAVVGSFAEPYVVSFRSTTGVDEWAGNLQVFPNPVEKGQTVNLSLSAEGIGAVQVEIVNALGMVVETQNSASLKGIVAPMVPGVYTLRITIKGKGTCYRKLVVE